MEAEKMPLFKYLDDNGRVRTKRRFEVVGLSCWKILSGYLRDEPFHSKLSNLDYGLIYSDGQDYSGESECWVGGRVVENLWSENMKIRNRMKYGKREVRMKKGKKNILAIRVLKIQQQREQQGG